jgi:hypothetical protein
MACAGRASSLSPTLASAAPTLVVPLLPLRSPLTSWRGAAAGRGVLVADPRAAAHPLRSGDEFDCGILELLPRCDLELSSPDATSSFADPSVEAAASTAVGVRRFGAGGNRRRQSEEIRRLRRPRLLGHAGGLRLSEEMVGPSLSQFSVISLLSVSSRRWLLWWWWWWWWWSWAAAGGGAAAADGGGWC